MSKTKSAEIVSLSGNQVWTHIRQEAAMAAAQEPMLASFLHTTILHHNSFAEALSFRLAQKLGDAEMNAILWREIINEVLEADEAILAAALADIEASKTRDPACRYYSQPLLYLKGYHALESYRVAHYLWTHEREQLALFMQSRLSELFSVDIHPAARLGAGIMMDHATGIVIGETAEVGDNVSMSTVEAPDYKVEITAQFMFKPKEESVHFTGHKGLGFKEWILWRKDSKA